jgi:hypothetical protein
LGLLNVHLASTAKRGPTRLTGSLLEECHMPTFANPQNRLPYDAPTDDGRPRGARAGRSHSLLVRTRVGIQRDELTRALAEGADPGSRPELALRAAQLTGKRSRRTFARTLRRTVAEAHQPALTRASVVIIRRGEVLNAESAIAAMIERLESSEPVRPEGMAIAERLLTNAEHSPLYNLAEPGTLRQRVLAATAAMGPGPAQSHEFAITV